MHCRYRSDLCPGLWPLVRHMQPPISVHSRAQCHTVRAVPQIHKLTQMRPQTQMLLSACEWCAHLFITVLIFNFSVIDPLSLFCSSLLLNYVSLQYIVVSVSLSSIHRTLSLSLSVCVRYLSVYRPSSASHATADTSDSTHWLCGQDAGEQ